MPNIEEEEFSKLHKKRVGLKIALYLFLKTNETTIKEKLSALFEKRHLPISVILWVDILLPSLQKTLLFVQKSVKILKLFKE